MSYYNLNCSALYSVCSFCGPCLHCYIFTLRWPVQCSHYEAHRSIVICDFKFWLKWTWHLLVQPTKCAGEQLPTDGLLFPTPAASRLMLKVPKGPMPRVGTREHEMFLNESTNGAKRREKGDFGQASKWANPQVFRARHAWQCGKLELFQCDSRHRPEGFESVPQNNPWLCIYDKPPKVDPTQLLLRKIKLFAWLVWTGLSAPTSGFVYRNCTANGWSELYPPYQKACAFRNDSEPESEVPTSWKIVPISDLASFFPALPFSFSYSSINSQKQ